MLLFRSHFVNLLVKLLNLNFSRPDVSLEFFDFIVQNELELFQLLDLFLEVQDTLLFFLYCGISFFDLLLLELDVIFELLLFLKLGLIHVTSLEQITGVLLLVSVFLLQLL